MDPKAAATEIESLFRLARQRRLDVYETERLSELLDGLAIWISRGGFFDLG